MKSKKIIFRHLPLLFFISLLSLPSLALEDEVYRDARDGFKLYKAIDGDYYFFSHGKKFTIEAGVNDSLESSLKRLQGDLLFEYPKYHKDHYRQISKLLLKSADQEMRFQLPDDVTLLKKSEEMQQRASKMTQAVSDSSCAGTREIKMEAKAVGQLKYLDVELDKASDQQIRSQIVKTALARDGFFDFGELKGVRLSWDTVNDNLGHGLYHAVNGTKMYDEKPWYEGDDRGLTFGTAEGGTLIFEKGEVTVQHYSKAYTKIAPQPRSYMINGREYTSYFSRDEQGRYYQEMLAVDGLLVELKRDVMNKKLYFKVKGQVEKTSGKGLAATLQKGWHELDKKNTIQYNNVPAVKETQYATSGEGALGKTYDVKMHDWMGVKATIEGRGGVSSELREQSFVSLDAEIAVNSNSWKRDSTKHKDLPAAVEASLYAGKKRYFNGEQYDRLGVRITGNIALSDSDVIGVYAGMGIEEDPNSTKMGSYEIQTRGRVDVTHFYGVNWTHYYK